MTNTDFVYELLKKDKMEFKDIVDRLVKENYFNIQKVANLYSDLTFDRRFISLENNVWDLSERHSYASKYVNIDELQDEDEVDEFDLQDFDDEEIENPEENEDNYDDDDEEEDEEE